MIKLNKAISFLLLFTMLHLLFGISAIAAPIVEDFQKTGAINQPTHFTTADFTEHYQDTEDLVSVRFPDLPGSEAGTLTLNDTAITADQEIPKTDLDGLVFTPAQDFEGTVTLAWQASNGTDFSSNASIDITIETPEPSPSPSISPSPSPTTTPSFPYIDLEGHWVNDYAEELALKNILRGEQIGGNFYFEPSRPLNRGDFVLLLNAAMGLTTKAPASDFEFIDKDMMPAWLYRQGKVAYEAGIIKGVSGPSGISFDPYGQLTRVEAITMLNNVIEPVNPVEPFELNFKDAAMVPSWGVAPIGKLLAQGIVQGYEDNTIRPFEPILREAAAVLISGMLKTI